MALVILLRASEILKDVNMQFGPSVRKYFIESVLKSNHTDGFCKMRQFLPKCRDQTQVSHLNFATCARARTQNASLLKDYQSNISADNIHTHIHQASGCYFDT